MLSTTAKKMVLALLVLCMGLFVLMGCDLDDVHGEKEGTLILRLTRSKAELGSNKTISFVQEIEAASQEEVELPRTVDQVLSLLDGYRIRIQGGILVDETVTAWFPEGEDEIVVKFNVPALPTRSYAVTCLALAYERSNSFHLLGAGRKEDIIVQEGENTVAINMRPYRYDFEGDMFEGTELVTPEKYTLKGPLLEYIFEEDSFELRYSTSRTTPSSDNFNSSISGNDIEHTIVDDERWYGEIKRKEKGETLFYQTRVRINSVWGSNLYFYTPSVALNEDTGAGEIHVEPVW